MRRQLATMVFATVIGAAAVPVFAFGADPAVPKDTSDPVAAPAPVAVQRVSVPATGMRDEVAMVLVGTGLIGLAAAVRRAA